MKDDAQIFKYFLVPQHGCFTCMHKFYSVEQWKQFAAEAPEAVKYVAASSGTGAGPIALAVAAALTHRSSPRTWPEPSP